MTAWSLPLRDLAEWLPEQRDTRREPTGELKPGTIVVYERKPYRIDTITLDDPPNWPNSTREKWTEDGAPDPAHWPRRPFTLSLRPADNPEAKPLWLSATQRTWWWTLPEHYSVCRLCAELPPCTHVHTEQVMQVEGERMALEMAILPGCCHACRQPATSRQRVIRFEGGNLLRPDLPDGSAIFHLRESCHYSAQQYDAKWAAAEPGRTRRLYCEGRGRHHYDGSFDCTEPGCPGKPPTVGHRSEEWHTVEGARRGYTSGCWCVSGDLTARLNADESAER